MKDRGVPFGYVEVLNDARKPLTDIFSILLDSLACHEQVRLIDCIDFLYCHIELKSQFN